MKYLVLLRTPDNKRVEKTVEANSYSVDVHWVTFEKNYPPVFVNTKATCDNCGWLGARPRVTASSRFKVASYPAATVLAVEVVEE